MIKPTVDWSSCNYQCTQFKKLAECSEVKHKKFHTERTSVPDGTYIMCTRRQQCRRCSVMENAISVLDSNDITLIRKNIHTARINIYPNLPRDFPQLHAKLSDVINKIQMKNNEKWIFINDVQNNIVCFTTQMNLDFLKQCDSIFMDGTFSSCPFPFKKLFVIYGIKNSSYVPLLFRCCLVNVIMRARLY